MLAHPWLSGPMQSAESVKYEMEMRKSSIIKAQNEQRESRRKEKEQGSFGGSFGVSSRSTKNQEYWEKNGTLFNKTECEKAVDDYVSYATEAAHIFSISHPDLIEDIFV